MVARIASATVAIMVAAAALTLACWFVFSWTTDATLVTFRTGSMSPTIPQGSMAVTLPVTAAELRTGDVVTVQRDGEALPVTHRVVEVRTPPPELAAPAGARELVLQGDANATVDARPYVVTEVRRTVFAVPRLGAALMVIQSPIGMGSLTLLAGALVTWAFWPRSSTPAPSEAPSELARAAP